MALTVGSLFSGIGGIDLGLERAGMVTRWFCEIDPHCRNVLARHWPGLPIYGDITAVDWSGVPRVDVLAGGFPCQPVSQAGRQRAQSDDRWLWPEFARAIRELRPRYVLVENVRNLLAVNGGSAFAEVLGDLAALGFDAEWDCIPASAVGAPHQRDRFWLIAYPGSSQLRMEPGRVRRGRGTRREPSDGRAMGGRRDDPDSTSAVADSGTVADTEGIGRKRSRSSRTGRDGPTNRSALADPNGSGSQGHRGFSVYGSGADEWLARARSRAVESWWGTEPDVGRVAHGVPHRVDRLRSLGNAVVPQVVEWIGRRIVAFDEAREVSAA